jgi:transmembrane sensor
VLERTSAMTTRPSDADIVAYLTGTLDPADAQRVREYFSATSGGAGALAGLSSVLQSELLSGQVPDPRASLAHVLARVDERESSERSKGIPTRGLDVRGSRHLPMIRVAIAGAIAAAAAITIALTRVATVSQSPSRTYATAVGQRARVTMDDGTVVTLGPATKLQVRDRAVIISGEAYFAVKSPSRAPFVVTARNLTARVIGTAFDVRAYESDTSVRVVVAAGRIAIDVARDDRTDRRSGAVLSAGDVAEWNESQLRVTPRTDVASYLEWLEGRIEFDGTPLSEVLLQLKRWYGIDATLADPALGKLRLTASLKASSRREVIAYVATPLHLRYEWRGDSVVFSSY